MKNKLIKNFLILSAITFSFNVMAEQPKEKIELNSNYNPKGLSVSVQGVANQILDKATSSKYLVYNSNNIEYAYSIKRLGSGDVKYIGKQSDINGLIFLEVSGYKNGVLLNTQLTTYRPSKYQNAIKLEKFDRNENKPYKFDIGIDSKGNLFGISSEDNVTYFLNKDTIKKPIDIEKQKNPAFF